MPGLPQRGGSHKTHPILIRDTQITLCYSPRTLLRAIPRSNPLLRTVVNNRWYFVLLFGAANLRRRQRCNVWNSAYPSPFIPTESLTTNYCPQVIYLWQSHRASYHPITFDTRLEFIFQSVSLYACCWKRVPSANHFPSIKTIMSSARGSSTGSPSIEITGNLSDLFRKSNIWHPD